MDATEVTVAALDLVGELLLAAAFVISCFSRDPGRGSVSVENETARAPGLLVLERATELDATVDVAVAVAVSVADGSGFVRVIKVPAVTVPGTQVAAKDSDPLPLALSELAANDSDPFPLALPEVIAHI